MPLKQYVLLDHLKPSIAIYTRVNKNQRQRVTQIPKFGIPNRVTFTNKDGVSVTHRYKTGIQSVIQSKQIKEQDIPANARFTTQERRDLEFYNNVLTTTKKSVQDYIESLPYMEGVDGSIDNTQTPVYKLVDKKSDIKKGNDDFKKRLLVGNFISELNLDEAKEVVLRVHGSSFEFPKEGTDKEKTEELQNVLINFMDEADDKQLDRLVELSETKIESSKDEDIAVLVGMLLNEDLISFTAKENKISRRDGDKWIDVKAVPNDAPLEEKQRLFVSYLNSDTGNNLLNDLRELLKNNSKSKK